MRARFEARMQGHLRRAVKSVLALLYSLLYHRLAWSYDLVARLVSVGHWFRWVAFAASLTEGPRVLELGCGTGHLTAKLGSTQGCSIVGLDESAEMLAISRRRLHSARSSRAWLVRARTQALPFLGGCFGSVVSTFPGDFIAEPTSVAELWRILGPAGTLVVIPAAWPLWPRVLKVFGRSSLRTTVNIPAGLEEALQPRLGNVLEQRGFLVTVWPIARDSSVIVIVQAKKPPD